MAERSAGDGLVLKPRDRFVSLSMHAVCEREIELNFGGANAGAAVGSFCALGLILIELLSTHWFWNMTPSWADGCCCELRSRAWQRDRIRWQRNCILQRKSTGPARR